MSEVWNGLIQVKREKLDFYCFVTHRFLGKTRVIQGKHGGGYEAQRQEKLWASTFMVLSVGKDEEGYTGVGLANLNHFSRPWS